MKNHRRIFEDIVHEFATRCDAASGFLGQFRTDESAHALIDSLLESDPERFNRFLDGFDVPEFPPFEKCVWVRELIDVVGKNYVTVTEWFLRDDLSYEELRLYFTIAWRYRQVVPLEEAGGASQQIGTGPIPEGPFLEELKANNLVKPVDRLVDAHPLLAPRPGSVSQVEGT